MYEKNSEKCMKQASAFVLKPSGCNVLLLAAARIQKVLPAVPKFKNNKSPLNLFRKLVSLLFALSAVCSEGSGCPRGDFSKEQRTVQLAGFGWLAGWLALVGWLAGRRLLTVFQLAEPSGWLVAGWCSLTLQLAG